MTPHESAPARGARLALLGALVGPLVAATAAIIVVPNLRFSAMAPHVRPVIETTTLLVAALITGVSYLRYSLDRDRLWLFVSLAFLVVTVHQLVFEMVLQPNGLAGADPTYLWLAARLEMGVLLLGAASTSRSSHPNEWSAATTYTVFGTLALLVLVVTQGGILLVTGGADVPARIITSSLDLGRADVLLGSVCAAVFLTAAGGLILSRDRPGSVLVWMSAALVMAAFSHLHYLLDPTLFTDRVSTGDLLRIATAAILVMAILADVRRSYAEVRARTIQLEAAFEAQRRRVLDLEELDRIQADLHRMLNHEILHPVAAIRTLAMTLATKWDRIDEDTKLRSVEAMLDQSEQLRNLAGRASEQNDLRFDRELDRAPRRVNDIMVTVERTFPYLAERLIVEPPNGVRDVVLEVDERRLMQVFHNLFSNADRFAPNGSPIVVETEQTDGSLVFSVADLGPGVPYEKADRVFDAFSRLAPGDEKEGAGLGLYIAQQIVEAHGGRIWVERSLAEGASFRFSIPVQGVGSKTETSA
jgi:signal transduction histidine kinase